MKQFYSNSPRACAKLRREVLPRSNWNNENPVSNFQAFCILGSREYAGEILLYPEKHMTMTSKPVLAMKSANGGYSFYKV